MPQQQLGLGTRAMCGISGVLCSRGQAIQTGDLGETVRRMLARMRHRGPDDAGVYVSPSGRIGLGNCRLAIIDLSTAGHQPMSDPSGRFHIVFNGEVYNHQRLRADLEKHGYRFRSNCDTEVALYSFMEWGESCVDYFLGFWALAIWDETCQLLFLSRDRLGKKPLYYSQRNGAFVFASELKGLLASGLVPASLDVTALTLYLSFYSVPSPYSLLESVRVLPPAHNLIVDGAGNERLRRYWRLPTSPPHQMTEADTVGRLQELMEDSVRLRLISDVPVGAFFSGGVDSALIVSLMNRLTSEPVRTFSIGFGTEGSRLDETAYAQEAAAELGTQHHAIRVSGADVAADFDRIIWALDQPSGDAINSYLVSKAARGHVKVVLSGIGGDELFMGYKSVAYVQRWIGSLDLVRHLLPGSLAGAFRGGRRWSMGSLSSMMRLLQLLVSPLESRVLFGEDELATLLTPEALSEAGGKMDSASDYLYGMLNQLSYVENRRGNGSLRSALLEVQVLDLLSYLPNMLLRDLDVMTMAHSLEGRAPFLDHRLVEFAWSIPPEMKQRSGMDKYILRQAFRRAIPDMVWRRKKSGFELPMAEWMRSDLRPLVEEAVSPAAVRARGLLDAGQVSRLYHQFLKGESHYLRVWSLVVLEHWLRQYVDGIGHPGAIECT